MVDISRNSVAHLFVKAFWIIPLPQTHQWPSGSVLKAGRREVKGSVTDHACRLSRSEFSVLLLRKCEIGSLRKTPTEGTSPPRRSISLLGTIDLNTTTTLWHRAVLYYKSKSKLFLYTLKHA